MDFYKQFNSQGPICSSLDMFVSIIERSMIRKHVFQPAADPGDCVLVVPGDLSRLPAPRPRGGQKGGKLPYYFWSTH